MRQWNVCGEPNMVKAKCTKHDSPELTTLATATLQLLSSTILLHSPSVIASIPSFFMFLVHLTNLIPFLWGETLALLGYWSSEVAGSRSARTDDGADAPRDPRDRRDGGAAAGWFLKGKSESNWMIGYPYFWKSPYNANVVNSIGTSILSHIPNIF